MPAWLYIILKALLCRHCNDHFEMRPCKKCCQYSRSWHIERVVARPRCALIIQFAANHFKFQAMQNIKCQTMILNVEYIYICCGEEEAVTASHRHANRRLHTSTLPIDQKRTHTLISHSESSHATAIGTPCKLGQRAIISYWNMNRRARCTSAKFKRD